MRKGYDDFLVLLAIAFVILIVLYLLTPFFGPVVTEPEEISVANFTLGGVGYSADTAVREESLGTLVVGETQDENMKYLPTATISAGTFGSSSEELSMSVPDWLKDTMRGVRISFTVKNAAQYGRLMIKWNGKEFFSEKASINDHTVFIDKQYVVANNNLEIYAEGPGAFFWAATTYELRDVSVDLEYGPSKLASFNLQQSDLESWSKGIISFFATGTGTLAVKVNGVKIYENQPLGYDEIGFEFGDVPLNVGRNIISFSDDTGVMNLQNTKLDIYLLSNELVRSRSFELSKEYYDMLVDGTRTGLIRYYVHSINTDGILKIEGTEPIVSERPKLGWNTVEFRGSPVTEGTNTLRFSGSGNWQITDVQVVLV